MAAEAASALDALPTQSGEFEGATKPVPKGVQPLFLTMTTQEKFGCVEKVNCTSEKPYVYITKAYFLEDIQFRGAISDFHPSKKKIQDYPEDELMLVWDENEIYGQNFYLSYLVKVKDAVLADEEARNAAAAATGGGGGGGGGGEGGEGGGGGPVEEVGEYTPPESKPWESLGSEAEITEEAVGPTRANYVLALSRRRREFQSPYKFADRDSHEDPNLQYNDCRPYKDPNFELKRMTHDLAIQAVPPLAEAKTQTTWFKPVNVALQYEPIAMDEAAKAEVLGSEPMSSFLATVRERYEDALQQNESVDIFRDDFASLAEEDASLGNTTDSELRELQSFNHLKYCADRMLCFVDWQPNVKGTVAVACAQRLSFDERVLVAGKVQTGYVLLWSFSDPIHPQFVLEAPCDIFCFRFCPSNADIVVGGLASGQVVVWDLAEARELHKLEKALVDDSSAGGEEGGSNTITAEAKMLSAVDQSHKRTITDLLWLPPSIEANERGKFVRKAAPKGTEASQFLTVGSDGQLLCWDVKKAFEALEAEKEGTKGGEEKDPKEKGKQREGWGPSLKVPLTHPEGGGELACTRMIIDIADDEQGPCKMLCVSEDGEFVTINLHDPTAEVNTRGAKALSVGHYGPCTTLQRSPFVPHVHLSVGDWTFNLWKEGVSSPLFVSPFAPCFLTCGAWSPTRPGLLFIGRQDGGIDVWDFLDRSHEPSMSVNIASAAITQMQFQQGAGGQQLVAVGDDQGTVHVLEVPRLLRRAANNEKSFTLNFFEREVKRVEYVQRRATVRSGDADPTAEGGAEGGGAAEPVATGDKAAEDDEKLEIAFKAMELAFKEEMGIVDPEPPDEAAAA